ncbi:MAG: hypothetical protein ABSE22_09995 [Xanthobacteraceae bacterium]|jgi:hypothetical protein
MKNRSRFGVFAVTFAVVYAIVYYVALYYNWPLFSYGPAVGEWTLFNHPASDGPTMYWYGWVATSAIAGALVGVVACCLPGNPGNRLWSGLAWLVPVCSIAAIAHLLGGYFTR